MNTNEDNMNKFDTTCEHAKIRMIAATLGFQQCTKTGASVTPIPGGDLVIAIGTPAQVRGLLAAPSAAAPAAPEQDDPDYELIQGDVLVAGTSGKNALNEILRYAVEYIQDGQLDLYKVVRTKVTDLEIRVPMKSAANEGEARDE